LAIAAIVIDVDPESQDASEFTESQGAAMSKFEGLSLSVDDRAHDRKRFDLNM
jgi:hypothetical protein